MFQTKISEPPETVIINGTPANLVSNAKFLGVTIDGNLYWSSHISVLKEKLNRSFYTLRILKKYVNLNVLKTVYFSNFLSALRFGITFWGQCVNVQEIFVIQKAVVRVIFNLGYRQSCRGVFRENKILTVTAVYIFEILMFMYKNFTLFHKSVSLRNDRNKHLIVPRHRLTIFEKGCFYSCIKIYNSLPLEIKTCTNCKEYRKLIFNLLNDIEPYTLQEFLQAV